MNNNFWKITRATDSKLRFFALGFCVIWAVLCFFSCVAPRKPGGKPRPIPPKPGSTTDLPNGKMDTVIWQNDSKTKPIPPSDGSNNGSNTPVDASKTYRIALLLPFQSQKFAEAEDGALPKNSVIALSFYAGAKLALAKMSTDPNSPKLVVDVFDSKVADADFQAVLREPKLAKSEVVLGGFRSAQVEALSNWGKLNGKIILSPEIASMGLAKNNPNFLQLNPSLRAHCVAMIRKALEKHAPDEIVLICKEKDRERLAFFQQNHPNAGGKFAEIVSPDLDETLKNDLKPCFKSGKPVVFIVPHWANQEFINSVFQKIKTLKGKTAVEIYGMPQWKTFENMEADDLENLHVSLAMAKFQTPDVPDLAEFKQNYYAQTGTAPDEDALNGYDSMIFLGKMLRKYGLDFPKNLGNERVRGLSAAYFFAKNNPDGATNYWENMGVRMIHFEAGRFEE